MVDERLPAWYDLSPQQDNNSKEIAVFTVSQTPYVARGVMRLTKREREILRLVAVGLSNSQVGKNLFIEETTVKFHLSSIYRKLNAHNRTQAVHVARLNHLIV